MNDKHRKFVDEYMIDMNATQAYLRAGYTCTEEAARVSASKLLTNANIVAEIATRQKVMQEKTGISVEWVLNNFKNVAERCMQAEPSLLNDDGDVIEWRFDSSGANKALESIGRHLGMFNDKLKLDALVTSKLEDFLS